MIFNVGHINIQEYARNTDEGADTYAYTKQIYTMKNVLQLFLPTISNCLVLVYNISMTISSTNCHL